jgi:cytohesin
MTQEQINKGFARASRAGDTEIVRLLIEKGADVNARNVWGTTPRRLVARRVNWKLVRLLLDAGADVNARNRGNYTPLHKACGGAQGPRRARRTETIRLLLSHGAEGGARDKDEMTPVGFVLEIKPDHPAREELLDRFREDAPGAVMEAYCSQTNGPEVAP